ncbi:hypothetical protein [Hamadaea tsunoensis]|uniref:hypothetical protein n=1 Tax=Hamadaea tsunoensis TaxID=53368 RepID=UPI0012FCADF9|nr:hypothetical protein [Hamadaea tsunoensis]
MTRWLGGMLLLAALLSFTPPGERILAGCHHFLDYYAGVFCLVSLSVTVMAGVAATDRLVLLIRHRVLLQAAHRSTALAAVVFLGLHIAIKVVEGHIRILDVLVPFLASYHATVLGLGTVAAYGLALAAWTGVIRGRFAATSRPWLWRVLHSVAYASWPAGIVHGLASGRSPKSWVTAGYVICVILVAVALLVRLSVAWGRRQRTPKAQVTATLPRIGATGTGPVPVQGWGHAAPRQRAVPRQRAATRPAHRPTPGGPMPPPMAPPVSPGVPPMGPPPEPRRPAADRRPGLDRRSGFDSRPGDRQSLDRQSLDRQPLDRQPGFDRQPTFADRQRPPSVRLPRPVEERARRYESVSDDEFWAHLRGEELR